MATIELCKHEMKDTKASTWGKTVMRQCKMAAKNDGYCDIHHPDSIARSLAQANKQQMIEDLRAIEQHEERIVGAFMRARDGENFARILDDIKASEQARRAR